MAFAPARPTSAAAHETSETDARYGDGALAHKARYVKVLVRNTGTLAAEGCEAFLNDVQKRAPTGQWVDVGFRDAIDLPWSLRSRGGPPGSLAGHYDSLNISQKSRRYVAVLWTQNDTGKIHLYDGWPLSLSHVFDHPNEYQLEIGVLSRGVVSYITGILEWGGHWDRIKWTKA
jgi:hypothetical protein